MQIFNGYVLQASQLPLPVHVQCAPDLEWSFPCAPCRWASLRFSASAARVSDVRVQLSFCHIGLMHSVCWALHFGFGDLNRLSTECALLPMTPFLPQSLLTCCLCNSSHACLTQSTEYEVPAGALLPSVAVYVSAHDHLDNYSSPLP